MSTTVTPATAEQSRHEVLFIVGNVADLQTLINSANPDTEVHVLDATQDGLAQIAAILAGRSGIDALHLISHGSSASLQLGSLSLNTQNLSDHAAALASIGRALNADADILLYGCEVGKGTGGAAFIDALAQATQADIAASDDLTGAANKGGNWTLEYTSGPIDALALQAASYQEVLLDATYDFEPGTGTVNFSAGPNTATQLNTSAGETLRITSADAPLGGLDADALVGAIDGSESLAGSADWSPESSFTFSLVSGKTFDLTSITLLEWAGEPESLTFTSNTGATVTYNLPAGNGTSASHHTFNVAADGNAENMQGITSFTVTTSDSLMYLAFDNIVLQNIGGPTVTDANISISGATGTGGAYKIGDTITATWDNTASGDNNLSVITGVSMDFSAFGGGAAVSATNSGNTWTATYIITAGLISATNRNVSVTATNDSGYSRTTADTSNATVDNITPTVSSVSVPANASYKVGDNLDFTVNFGENVTVNTVGGTPYLTITLDTGGTVNASYLSGSGSSALVFRYTVASGNLDSNGIAVGAAITANGGTLQDAAGNTATLTLNSVGSTAAVLVDGVAPAVTSVSVPTNGTYKIGDSLNFTVNFDENVTVTTGGGTPYLPITLDTGGTVQASYVSGSGTSALVFSYTVTSGNLDSNGIAVGAAITTSGGTLRDAAGNDATLTLNSVGSTAAVLVDGVAPTVTGVASSTGDGNYKAGDTLSIQISFSENVSVTGTPQLTLETGTTDRVINYSSGSGSSTLSFTYTVQAGDTSADLDYLSTAALALNGGTIRDEAGNDATLTLPTPGTAGSLGANQAIVIDTTAPTTTIASVSFSADSGSSASDFITKTAAQTVSGTLSANLAAGETVYVSLDNGSTWTAATATVGQSIWSLAGQTLSASNTLQVKVTDTAGNDGSVHSQAYVLDSAAPTVSNVSSVATDGIHGIGDVIAITVQFGETVTVTGTPQLTLETGTTDRSVDYTSGSGSNTLTFNYTVQAGDTSTDLDYLSTSALVLNGGTIADTAGNDANLSLATPGAAGSLGANKAIVIDTTPSITSATYDIATGTLVLSGSNFVSSSGADNDIVASKLTFTGQDGASYTLTDTTDVDISSTSTATLILSTTDQAYLQGLLNKNGSSAGDGTTYNLAAADDWMAGSPGAANIADLTGNGITVTNVATPSITSATYDADSGVLSITGTNLFGKPGAANDIVVSKLTLTGGTGNTSYTLTSGSNVEINSATSFSIILSGADKTAVDVLLDQLGATSSGGSTYNLAAADDWLAAADSSADIADAVNPVTVFVTPQIASVTYDAASGVLVVSGTNMQVNGAGADVAVSKLTLTGEGGATYTLTSPDVELDSISQFTVILNATDKAAINQILNNAGTTSTGGTPFNLAAADDWNTNLTAGDTASTINGVTVSNPDTPSITSAVYYADTGVLTVTGIGFLKLSGASNDIDVAKLTLTGEGGATYTLTTGSVEITNGTSFSVTVNATDKAAINQILNKNGTDSTGGTTYNLAAAEDWAAGAAAAVVVADLSGNGITVSNVAIPAITSATYDSATGTLVIIGTGFLKRDGATNDIIASKFTFTGEGAATYTLTDTADVEISSGTSFTITLSNTDKAAISLLINKSGSSSNDNTTYNLAAAEDWAAGADAAIVVADLVGNGITATVNSAPVITSNGGAATATLTIPENSTAVTTVTATDAESDPLTYSIAGGADAAKFSINATTGALRFVSAPNFEAPADVGANNVYEVIVQVSDGTAFDQQALFITVSDVNETPPTPDPDPEPQTQVDGVTVQTAQQTNSDGTTTTTTTIAPVSSTRVEDQATSNDNLADIPLVTSGSSTLLAVGLPIGVGVQSSAQEGSGLTLRQQLINASEPRISDDPTFQQILSDGIDAYLATVTAPSQVTVRTLVLTAASGSLAPGNPVLITGAVPGASNPNQQEALIIDARALPAGTTLQLDNIEFAIIVGSSKVIGGAGRNLVVGDEAAQYIVLGADDDILHGGGGNDTIGSRGGNDILYGDDGDDFVVGGFDDDVLYGGAGNDILVGGASDAGSWTFSLDNLGRMVVGYTAADTTLASIANAKILLDWSTTERENAQLDERFSILEQDWGQLSELALIYHAVVGARPGAALLTEAVQSGLNADALAQIAYSYFLTHTGVGNQPVETQMQTLIQEVWGSAPEEIVQTGIDYINEGGSWAHALKVLALHDNSRTLMEDAAGNLQLTQSLTLGELGLVPEAGNDQLFGGDGKDLLIGGNGSNLLDGGNDLDMAAFFGPVQNYQLALKETSFGTFDVVIRHVDSTDESVLRNIELFRFGESVYQGRPEHPEVVVGEFQAAADFLQLVGAADLLALGVPNSWI